MCLVVDGLEPVNRDVGVVLSGLQRSVAEQLLHRPQVSAALKEMGGKRVPQDVWVGMTHLGNLR